MQGKKMIFRILLLVDLISRLSGTFVVNVTQTSYQAEENNNVTLEWTFSPHTSSNVPHIHCFLKTDHGDKVLFYLHHGVEVSESWDEQFSGRVQFDRDVLREGRVRLRLSRLRTDDSGLYLCKVRTNYGRSSDRCSVSVSAAIDRPKHLRPNVGPQPQGRGYFGLIGVMVGAAAAGAVLLVCIPVFLALRSCFLKCVDMNKNGVFLAIY